VAKRTIPTTTENTTLYDLLEVNPRARTEVIEAAGRALWKIYHPDRKDTEHSTSFKRINDALEVLTDPARRAEYDRERFSIADSIVGEYRILEQIAEGAIGKTYKAEHLLLGEPVCIKHCMFLGSAAATIMLDEARAVWDLRHYALPAMRNVLKLDNGTIALVMSYIPGPTLAQIIAKVGKLDPEHMCWIAERIINACHYMHLHGTVHGDIKPQNIIVQPDEHKAVLVDFGLTMKKPSASSRPIGFTELFAPPEQEKSRGPLIPETDFYSLGMTMIYALNGGDEKRTKNKQVPDSVPDPLTQFIARMVQKDPLARPNWEKEDLGDSFQKIRQESFGRSRSLMKPIPGF